MTSFIHKETIVTRADEVYRDVPSLAPTVFASRLDDHVQLPGKGTRARAAADASQDQRSAPIAAGAAS